MERALGDPEASGVLAHSIYDDQCQTSHVVVPNDVSDISRSFVSMGLRKSLRLDLV